MIAKALLESLDDSTDLQTAKVTLNGEAHEGVERVQPYGTTGRPPQGAQALLLFIGGNRDNPLVAALDDGRYRVKVENGEFAIYSMFGNKIVMKADGSIEATPAVGKSFKVNGKIEATLDVVAGISPASVSLLTHVHPTAGSGPPSPPTPT